MKKKPKTVERINDINLTHKNFIFRFSNDISNSKGVTMIALVATVILLIILAGVTIRFALDDGLFRTTKTASEESKIENYLKELKAIEVEVETEGISKYMDTQKYFDKYEEKINLRELFEKAIVTRKSQDIISVQTEEEYIFYVTKSGVQYRGKVGEETEEHI